MNIGTLFKNILFPKICLGCGKIGAYFCPLCLKTFAGFLRNDTICPVCTRPSVDGATHPRCKTKYSPDGLISIFRYDGIIRKAIKLLKYQRVKDLTPEISTVIIDTLKNDTMICIIVSEKSMVIPVPLHKVREKSRWFNQSELLAVAIAEKLNIDCRTDVLIRTKFIKPQAGLHKADRLINTKDSFTLHSNHDIPQSVILFDDVWTTGATMRECTNVLKRGGVKQVWCLTIAR